MKKCASCTKDLPEAALHCVFCGAKQPPAAAVQPSAAKTAFGYSPSEMMQQLKGSAPPAAPYGAPPAAAPYQTPAMARHSPSHPPPQPSYPAPQANYPAPPPSGGAGLAPQAAANAATMFVPGGGGGPSPQQQLQQLQQQHQQPYQPPMQPPPQQYNPPPSYGAPAPMVPSGPSGGMGIHAQNQVTPAPLPVVASGIPYRGAQAARAGSPIEPWKDSLRVVMFIWGAIGLAAFATPMSIDPLVFRWKEILDGDTTMKLIALLLPAISLLAIVLAAIPLQPLPRGILAAVLGLTGTLLPVFVIGFPPWQMLITLVGIIALIPGLLVRNEYTESLFARVLVTVGVICSLAPLLIPAGGDIPLVGLFKALIDAPGQAKIGPILELGGIALVVMSLLVWMPGPATGGGKLFAWAIILWSTLVTFIVKLVIAGGIGDVITKSPGMVLQWAPQAVFAVLFGYGLATVFGKQLE